MVLTPLYKPRNKPMRIAASHGIEAKVAGKIVSTGLRPNIIIANKGANRSRQPELVFPIE